ncbi:hypothetical protein BDZ89DRAFT_481004 [Hymenopellis radicata]|nr:hypothetical protein BDZ89DRAFT_481004 [Hymenopellis radicata]
MIIHCYTGVVSASRQCITFKAGTSSCDGVIDLFPEYHHECSLGSRCAQSWCSGTTARSLLKPGVLVGAGYLRLDEWNPLLIRVTFCVAGVVKQSPCQICEAFGNQCTSDGSFNIQPIPAGFHYAGIAVTLAHSTATPIQYPTTPPCRTTPTFRS